MAEPDYSAPVRVPSGPGPGSVPGPIPAPLLSAQAASINYAWRPMSYESPYGDPLLSQLGGISAGPFWGFDHHTTTPYPPPPRMSQQPLNQSPTNPTSRNYSARRMQIDESNSAETLFRDEPPPLYEPHSFFPIPRGYMPNPVASSSPHVAESRRSQHSPISAEHNPSSLPPTNPTPMTLDNLWSPGRQPIPPQRRPPQPDHRPRHHHHHHHHHYHPVQQDQSRVVRDRHDHSSVIPPQQTQGRPANRSPSPRTTSTRRTFESYSLDLTPNSTSSDAEELAARTPPSARAQNRAREARPRYLGHAIDTAACVARQIQDLKATLTKYISGELAKDTSPTCDICAKDYSATHVQPSEEEEVAVKLVCGHTFGEFCISQWFDSCKKHKNKITCPMCRKVLIQPIPSHVYGLSRPGRSFHEIANSLRAEYDAF